MNVEVCFVIIDPSYNGNAINCNETEFSVILYKSR